jgi:hypothetical protein
LYSLFAGDYCHIILQYVPQNQSDVILLAFLAFVLYVILMVSWKPGKQAGETECCICGNWFGSLIYRAE